MATAESGYLQHFPGYFRHFYDAFMATPDKNFQDKPFRLGSKRKSALRAWNDQRPHHLIINADVPG